MYVLSGKIETIEREIHPMLAADKKRHDVFKSRHVRQIEPGPEDEDGDVSPVEEDVTVEQLPSEENNLTEILNKTRLNCTKV